MSEYHRLTDQKYSEAEYLFQTIEMAKSDEEFNVELCTTPPPHTELELALMDNDLESNIYSGKLVKYRRPIRRYTVSHGGGIGSGSSCSSTGGGAAYIDDHSSIAMCANGGSSSGLPPAPPSTPTSLTPTNTSLSSSSLPNSGIVGVVSEDEHQPLDYAPKYKKKLKEQQRTDAELAELFNVVSITATKGTSSSSSSKTKIEPLRFVSSKSRSICKQIVKNLKIFTKINEKDEEDSVSAPEYDTEEEETRSRFHRLGRRTAFKRMIMTKRQRRFARFEHAERMETMVFTFDEVMNFNKT